MTSELDSELKDFEKKFISWSQSAEPHEELARLLSLLTDFETLEESESQILIKKLPSLLQALLKCKNMQNKEALDNTGEILSKVLLLLPQLHENSSYLEALRAITKPSNEWYRVGQSVPYSMVTAITPDPQPLDHEEWRENLQEGDEIDAIKIDVEYERKCWARATITEITPEGISIKFEEEDSIWDRKLSRSSEEIAPFKTYSGDDEWREELDVDMLCDGYDTCNCWYYCTVIDTRIRDNDNGSETTELYIGYRIYDPSGEKFDEKGRFNGWSQKYDEWMSRRSPRISKTQSFGRHWKLPLVHTAEEQPIDDSNDIVEKRPWAFCMPRQTKINNFYLLRNANRFGHEKGFEFIMERVKDPEISFNELYSLVDIVGDLYCYFHIDFCKNFVEEFREAVFSQLLNSPESIIRLFDKTKIETICLHFTVLLKRLYTIQEKNTIMEEFQLAVSLRCFKSEYLDRRIQGLKSIQDAWKLARMAINTSLKPADLARWLKENEIVTEIYGPKGHYQLIQRTSDILRLMLNEGLVDLMDLENIWAATERHDNESKLYTYKTLEEISTALKSDHLEFLVQKIQEIPTKDLIKEHINLINELTKYPMRGGRSASMSAELLWEICISEDSSAVVSELVLNNFCELMKMWDLRSNRINVLIKCVEKIRENTSTRKCLVVITKILGHLPKVTTPNDPYTKDTAIEKLVHEHDLFPAFFNNIRNFKETSIQFTQDIVVKDAIQDLKIQENATYGEHIESRLEFLHFFLANSDYQLTERHMNELWEQFYGTALCSYEKDLFLRWLKESTDSQSQGKSVFDPNGVYNFFKDRIASSDVDFSDMNNDGFKVFKSFFLLVNVGCGGIQQVIRPIETTSTTDWYASTTTTTTDNEKNFDYRITQDPFLLEGAECLWKIILQADNVVVQEDVVEFINDIYENLDQMLDIREIRTNFIEKFLGYVNSIKEPKPRSRSLILMKTFVEESEKRGTGGIKSHSAMVKGELHSLTINNTIVYANQSDIPKKFELLVFSNTTIWDLRCQIASKARTFPDLIRLTRSLPYKEIPDSENGKTLNELRIRRLETFSVSKRATKIPRTPLLTPEGDIVQKAADIFRKIFHQFADKEGGMSPEGCAAFTNSCTGDSFKGTDRRIIETVEQYDSDNDGYLTEADFVQFYKDACKTKPSVVWSNLWAHHYRNDLKRFDDPQDDELDIEELPRYILTAKKEYLVSLFDALEDPSVANDAWSLIIKLPTDQNLYDNMLALNGEWSELIDSTSTHKFLYALQIISVLMDESEDPEELAQRQQWKSSFIQKGGFDYVLGILMNMQYSDGYFEKSTLDNLLKLVSFFILGAFAASEPDIYDAVNLVRKESSTGVFDEQELDQEPPNSPSKDQDKEEEPKVEKAEEKPKEKSVDVFKQFIEEVLKAHDLGYYMVDSIDFPQLQEKLISIMCHIIQLDEVDAEEQRIADSVMELWVSSVLHKNNLIIDFYTFHSGLTSHEFILKGLTTARHINIRRKICNSLNQIALKVYLVGEKQPRTFLLELLEANIPETYYDTKEVDYSQFFELFCNLIEFDIDSINYTEMRDHVLKLIKNHPYSERRNSYVHDRVLIGLLNLLGKTFETFPELRDIEASVVEEMQNTLLFPPQSDFNESVYNAEEMEGSGQQEPPKCKTRDSRGAAYRMLGTLGRNNAPILDVLIAGIMRNKDDLEPVTTWNHGPSSQSRSSLGYSGIRNLGMICYMNSVIQQLFMIPMFRYSVLNIDDKVLPTQAAKGEEPVVDDNILHQFQRILGFLELTERIHFDPKDFCFSFKDWEGLPVNTSQQQDAMEFINRFFETLEGIISSTPYKHILQDTFGVRTKNQMICQGGCDTVRGRNEPNFFISVDIARNKTIEAGLQEFIAGNIINDYMCETCDKKVDIESRNYIDQLPNVLILHLKRFAFNFDTLRNEKINSRVEFPPTLNVLPYHIDNTKEGEEHNLEEYDYELVGIVVHSGTADGGHYYSYIRHRLPDGSLDPEKWFEFNDSSIKVYNSSNIESDCFGKSEQSLEDATASWYKTVSVDNRKNAYCLFYERKIKSDIRLVIEGSGEEEKCEMRSFKDHQKFVPDNVFHEVLKSNEKYMFEKHMYAEEYFKYLIDLFGNATYQPDKLAQLGTEYAIDIVAHSFESKSLPDLMTKIKELYANSEEACIQLVERMSSDNLKTLSDLMLACTEKTTRECVADLFSFVLNRLVAYDFSDESLVKRFIDAIFVLIPAECSKYWTRFQQFWDFLYNFASGGKNDGTAEEAAEAGKLQIEYLMEIDAITKLIDFYLAEKSPFATTAENRTQMGNKFFMPCFDGLIKTVSLLTRHVNLCGLNMATTLGDIENDYQFTEDAQMLLNLSEFYDKTLREGYDGEALGEIVGHLTSENEEFSKMIATVIIKGLNEIEYEEVKSFYAVLDSFLTCNDSLQSKRIEWVMGVPTLVKSYKMSLPAFGASFTSFIDEEVYQYVSTLSFGQNIYAMPESILSLIWRQRKRWDHHCIVCMKYLFNIAQKSEILSNYIANLPPPTYQFKRYIDWIEEYIDNYREYNLNWVSYGFSMKRVETSVEALKAYNAFKDAVQPTTPEVYIIGDTKSEDKSHEDNDKDIHFNFTVYEYATNYAVSKANGKRNDALPSLRLRSEMQVSHISTSNKAMSVNQEFKKRVSITETADEAVNAGEDPGFDVLENPQDAIEMKPITTSTDDPEEAPQPQDVDDVQDEASTDAQAESEEEAAETEAAETETESYTNTVLLFVGNNYDSVAKNVTLKLVQGENMNYRCPITPIEAEFGANSKRDLFTLVKEDPSIDSWGDLYFEYEVTNVDQPDTSEPYDPIDDWPSVDVGTGDDMRPPPGQIACPDCTFFNPDTAFRCEICGHTFGN